MPLLKFHIYKGRSEEQVAALLDTAHSAMVRSFQVPARDRYQIVTEYSEHSLIAQDTGLGISRSPNFLLLEVVSRPRTTDQKQEFYANLCADLESRCAIASSDVMISFSENTDADWSFGYGRAQFLTVEL